MSDVESVANQSAVIHSNLTEPSLWASHMWEERGSCPHCQGTGNPGKEPPPPATEERIEDISEVLTAPRELIPFAVFCLHESGRDADGLCLDCGK